jgi:hypothetical protein
MRAQETETLAEVVVDEKEGLIKIRDRFDYLQPSHHILPTRYVELG